MKVVKVLLVLGVLVIAGVVGLAFFGLSKINDIVEMAVEQAGPTVTNTSVLLDGADIELLEGRGELNGLSIANPEGYSDNNVFEMGKVVFAIDPQSVQSDVIVIKEITIDGAQLLAEHKNLKDTNLGALMDNIKKMGKGSTASKSESQSNPSAGDDGQPLQFAVNKFSFTNGNIALKSEQLGDYALKLPKITLANIGSAEQGLTATELAETLLKPVVKKAQDTVAKRIEEEVGGKAEDALKEKLKEKLSDKDKEKIEGLKSLLKGGS
ncbi:hypothetical protein [Marinibactrum halimedae]|uniref:AsmA domain-containing protein n=1 Tax=Marinibactrum halimedae TaxID=1444977 RepID=A0AA37WLP1_9GAMM|nr:hypothetical protein [Marinibactrum halimedae]MCD9459894.1 hypothetical protein [Marinibactrum halimedae]GLS25250.1 hypothetical protein GCM10007877_09640 [Marinibactrum halimedae]